MEYLLSGLIVFVCVFGISYFSFMAGVDYGRNNKDPEEGI